MELFAKIENLGPFHIFWTLSCGDTRFPENFTCLLQDQEILYTIIDGKETCLINGMTIEKFMEQNSSKHEFIRNNILTATRNFDFRLKKFLSMVIKNACSDMPVKHYSYRIEFQNRGSAHAHGVLWLDIDKIVENSLKDGHEIFEHLQSAMETVSHDKIPSREQAAAICAFVNKFITCSLRLPYTKRIAEEVNSHHHTKSCEKRGTRCRFHFPRFPSEETKLATPIRLVKDEKKRKELRAKIKLALNAVRDVLEDKKKMDEIEKIHQKEIQDLVNERDVVLRASNIIEDEFFKSLILKYPLMKDEKEMNSFPYEPLPPGNPTESTSEALIRNLHELKEIHQKQVKDLEENEDKWSYKRLLQVLLEADDLCKILDIDETQPDELMHDELMAKYHQLLGYSLKGFAMVLKRDVNEVWINNYNYEWLGIWNCNLDISACFDFYAVITYISDYYMKVDIHIKYIFIANSF